MPGQHAVYAPSSAKRWVNCTASADAVARSGVVEDDDENSPANIGTRAHDEIDRLLGHMNGVEWSERNTIPAQNPNHFAAYGIGLFISYVSQLPKGRAWIEQRVYLTNDIWGRLDFAHWDEVNRILTIVDYKNGYSPVDADAEQLKVYAAAIIYTMQLRGVEWIRLAVVQPNDWRPVPRVKQHVMTAAELYQFAQLAVIAATGAKTFTAGEHCRYCPLFGRCEATRDLLEHLSLLFARRVEDVPPELVSKLLICKQPIADYFKNLEAHALKSELKAPGSIPGMKLVAKQTHRDWSDPVAARKFIVDKFGAEALDIPGPAQIEARGISKDEVAKYTTRPDGGPALAFAKDSRKPFAPKSAAEMFAGAVAQVQGVGK